MTTSDAHAEAAARASLDQAPSRTRLRYVKILLVAYCVWFACYELVGTLAARLPTRDLSTALDLAIPLLPSAVWIYEACYLLPLVPVLLARDWQRINVWLSACLVANLTAFGVYFALPIAFPRPTLGSSLAEQILALEYAFDFYPGANNLPSMHVTLSWLSLFACYGQGRSRPLLAVLTLLVVLISVSTLLVKQHLVYDVLAGLVWAPASWLAARRLCQSRARLN